MSTLKGIIKDPVGLHARPASLLVSAASKFNSKIILLANGETANLKSIMNVMALAVKTGSEFEITADGNDSDAAIAAIKEVMQSNKII